jgi:hypothetical protein
MQSYVSTSPSAPVQYLLQCNYQKTITSSFGCTYDQDTLAVTMAALDGKDQPLDLCPPLRTEYTAFCFTS